MEIVKKGTELPDGVKQVNVETRAKIYPGTPDGSQWIVHLHFLGDLGQGSEVLGEMKLRSYNGGVTPLPGFIEEAAKVVPLLVEKAIAAFAAAQEQAAQEQGRITLASSMPNESRN